MKISMVGVGKVGSATVFKLLENKKITEISLVDVLENKLRGEYLDLLHAIKGLESDKKLKYSKNFDIVKDSHLVIITAGYPRKGESSRLELAERNVKIVKDIVNKIKNIERNCLILVVTNPVDITTYFALKTSGFKRERVFGMGSLLDFFRLKTHEPQADMIIAEHGATMVFVPNNIREESKNYTKTISKEIIELKGGTWWAPAVAISNMVDSIVYDKKDEKTASVLLNGEYGIRDVCLGVPVKLGSEGIEEVMEKRFSDKELELLKSSSNVLKKTIEKCRRI